MRRALLQCEELEESSLDSFLESKHMGPEAGKGLMRNRKCDQSLGGEKNEMRSKRETEAN